MRRSSSRSATTVDEKLHATLEQRLGAVVQARLRPARAGAQGSGRDADAGCRRRRSQEGTDQRQVARHVGRSAARESARADADSGAIRQERRDAARAATERVEFAIRMPGRDDGAPCLAADRRQVSARGLSAPVRMRTRAARSGGAWRPRARRSRTASRSSQEDPRQVHRAAAHDRFCDPVLPTESLYAEVLRRPGLADTLQREYRVTIGRADDSGGDPQQPAAGISDARHRAALDRSLETCWLRSRPSSARSATSSPGPRNSSTRSSKYARRRPRCARDHRAQAARRRGAAGKPKRRSCWRASRGWLRRESQQRRERGSRPRSIDVDGGGSWRSGARHVRSHPHWRRRRVLATAAIPESLWREALEALPFLAIYTEDEIERLRERVVVFLSEKSIVGAAGFDVTPLMRVVIAMQACALRPGSTRATTTAGRTSSSTGRIHLAREYEDEAGVVHRRRERSPARRCPAARSCCPGPTSRRAPIGPARDESGHSRVRAQARHAQRRRQRLSAAARGYAAAHVAEGDDAAYEHFRARVEAGEDTAIDPYAAESPAEFFAVLSEVFFAEPTLLLHDYRRGLSICCARFYRQDPARRAELLMEGHDGLSSRARSMPAGRRDSRAARESARQLQITAARYPAAGVGWPGEAPWSRQLVRTGRRSESKGRIQQEGISMKLRMACWLPHVALPGARSRSTARWK